MIKDTWQERFDKEFGDTYLMMLGGPYSNYEGDPKKDMVELKSFISHTVQEAREEVVRDLWESFDSIIDYRQREHIEKYAKSHNLNIQ